MTPEQFCYWLQGRAELMPDTPPSEAEWKMIAEHLATVFVKKTGSLQDYMQAPKTKNPQLIPPSFVPPVPFPSYESNRIYCQANNKTFVPSLQC